MQQLSKLDCRLLSRFSVRIMDPCLTRDCVQDSTANIWDPLVLQTGLPASRSDRHACGWDLILSILTREQFRKIWFNKSLTLLDYRTI